MIPGTNRFAQAGGVNKAFEFRRSSLLVSATQLRRLAGDRTIFNISHTPIYYSFLCILLTRLSLTPFSSQTHSSSPPDTQAGRAFAIFSQLTRSSLQRYRLQPRISNRPLTDTCTRSDVSRYLYGSLRSPRSHEPHSGELRASLTPPTPPSPSQRDRVCVRAAPSPQAMHTQHPLQAYPVICTTPVVIHSLINITVPASRTAVAMPRPCSIPRKITTSQELANDVFASRRHRQYRFNLAH